MRDGGARAAGVEISPEYIGEAEKRAKVEGIALSLVQGKGEALPFENESYDFANLSEVIEHVQNPKKVLEETYRILAPGGYAYVSVPNRFGLKDPHFHLYFVNWLPRAWSDAYIGLFGLHKDYADSHAGHQRLRDMHYSTYGAFRTLARSVGFEVRDIREETIASERNAMKRLCMGLAYPLARAAYFDSFHFLLLKRS